MLRQRAWGNTTADVDGDDGDRAGLEDADPAQDVDTDPAQGVGTDPAAAADVDAAADVEEGSVEQSAPQRAVLSLVPSAPAPPESDDTPGSGIVPEPVAALARTIEAALVRDRDAEEVAEESAGDAARIAYEDGVRLLARRARSSGELREELLRLEHSANDVDILIDEFRDSHYLDDVGLARTVTEKLRTSKRASRAQIRVKLRDRRLPDAVIDEVLGELDESEEYSLLRDAAEARAAKLGGLERQVAERRLLGFLARRGWSGEPATRAVKAALDGSASSRSGRPGSPGRSGGSGGGVRFR